MTCTATGTFDVTLTPLDIEGELVGHRLIDKRFHGGLEAVSTGQMLSAGTATKGAAVPSLTISVAPDSGTEALQGLTGSMTIVIEGGTHRYTMTYELPATG